MALMFRVQGCKLAGCLLLLLVSQGPAAVSSLCCLVAVAYKVIQCQGAICGRQPCWPWSLSLASRAPSGLLDPSSCGVMPPVARGAGGRELWWKWLPFTPTIRAPPSIPGRVKGDVSGPLLAASQLTRDDFTPLKGLCEAVHLLLSKQQVKVVLRESKSGVS